MMPTWYRLHARETDTHIERVGILTCSAASAAESAVAWASTYYGDDGATWFRPAGNGRYLAGRLYDDGYREPATCEITIEADSGLPEQRRRIV